MTTATASPSTRARAAAADLPDVVTTTLFALFGWFVMWQGTLATPVTWPDSQAYEGVAAHPLWSLSFWASEKPPITPLLWKLTGSATGFVLIQSAIFALSWGLLAWTFARLFPTPARRMVAVAVVLAFASSAPVMLWNRSVLSDSLAMSAVALLVVALLRLTKGFTWERLAVVAVVAGVNVTNRYSQVATVGLLGVGALVLALRRWRTHRRVAGMASLAACLLAVVIGSMYLESRSTLSSTEITSVYQTRVYPFPNRVAWFAAHGLPDARLIDTNAAHTPPPYALAKVVTIDVPAVQSWVDHHGTTTYVWWLASHPLNILTEPFASPERAFVSDQGNLLVYAGANRTDSPLSGLLYPGWRWMTPMILIASVCVFAAARQRNRVVRLFVVVGATGLFTMLFAWHSDAQETDRHMLEGAVELRLGVLLLLTYALLVVSPGELRDLYRRLRRLGDRSPLSEPGTESPPSPSGPGQPPT